MVVISGVGGVLLLLAGLMVLLGVRSAWLPGLAIAGGVLLVGGFLGLWFRADPEVFGDNRPIRASYLFSDAALAWIAGLGLLVLARFLAERGVTGDWLGWLVDIGGVVVIMAFVLTLSGVFSAIAGIGMHRTGSEDLYHGGIVMGPDRDVLASNLLRGAAVAWIAGVVLPAFAIALDVFILALFDLTTNAWAIWLAGLPGVVAYAGVVVLIAALVLTVLAVAVRSGLVRMSRRRLIRVGVVGVSCIVPAVLMTRLDPGGSWWLWLALVGGALGLVGFWFGMSGYGETRKSSARLPGFTVASGLGRHHVLGGR